jgi:hypothetical protein
MSIEKSGDYFFEREDSVRCLPVLYVPVLETDEDKERLNKIGFERHLSVQPTSWTGEVGLYGLWCATKITPYTQALNRIKQEEQAGKLSPGSHMQAFNCLEENTFDTSEWSKYLPDTTL